MFYKNEYIKLQMPGNEQHIVNAMAGVVNAGPRRICTAQIRHASRVPLS